MKITPLEIKQKVFEKAFRGYEKQEVQAFLGSLAKEWERMQIDYRDMKAKWEHTQQEIAKLREVEDSLFKTLKTAEDTRTNLIEQASKTADLHLKETQIKTETLLNGAKNRAKDMLEKAENKALHILENAQNEIRKLQKSYTTIEQHREQLISSLKILSQDMLQKIQRMEKMPQPSRITQIEEHLLQCREGEDKLDLDDYEVHKSAHSVTQATQPKKAKTKPSTPVAAKDKKSFFDELK